jgi:hypothetical protein
LDHAGPLTPYNAQVVEELCEKYGLEVVLLAADEYIADLDSNDGPSIQGLSAYKYLWAGRAEYKRIQLRMKM